MNSTELYNINETVTRIKKLAKQKGIYISQLLEAIGVNKNALASMTSRGTWGNTETLFKIADYLQCSVDYLLGRTNNPEINTSFFVENSALNSEGAVVNSYNNNTNSNNTAEQPFTGQLEREVFSRFDNLDISDKLEILSEIIRREKK